MIRLAALAVALLALPFTSHVAAGRSGDGLPAAVTPGAITPEAPRPTPSWGRGAHRAASRSARRAGVATGMLPAILLRIRRCESHDDYRAHSALSTASGAFQVLDGTWNRYAGYRRAADAPRAVQDAQAFALYRDRGTQPWNASRGCWA